MFSIGEDLLLPDCGLLHPYRCKAVYSIDGYKDGKPLDMDVEEVKHRISEDFQCYILPSLAQIDSFETWKRKKAEGEKLASSERIHLLTYFSSAQMAGQGCVLLAGQRPLALPPFHTEGGRLTRYKYRIIKGEKAYELD